LDELVGQLILIQKVEKGLMDSNEGRFISEEELEKEIDKWFE
jgi:predicted transcriptional regulator